VGNYGEKGGKGPGLRHRGEQEPEDWGQGPRGESIGLLFTRRYDIHSLRKDKKG